ncbi:MAG: hypothetical protein QME66_07915 [Candidatus Eisenbacteria bacterium]|nr:hypothetical protein [Candidatus Eisenbacteria bacterium]
MRRTLKNRWAGQSSPGASLLKTVSILIIILMVIGLYCPGIRVKIVIENMPQGCSARLALKNRGLFAGKDRVSPDIVGVFTGSRK